MNTLRQQLVKHSSFLSNIRHTKEQNMTNNSTTNGTFQQPISRSTGGQGANKRIKRTSEELEHDIAKVDELVASGKFNQIEALNYIGLQSSVYHYKKKQLREDVAKSLKPRKFAHRPTRQKSYTEQKEQLLQKLEPAQKQVPVVKAESSPDVIDEMLKMKRELAEFKAKYAKLQEYVIDNVVLK